MSNDILQIARALSEGCDALTFDAPVAYVYNPLQYAWESHALYLGRYATARGQTLLLGMNPGPFGMAQTGVPFGDVELVRDWLGIEAPVGTPPDVHPKRPVQGFACPRSEVSGTRLWGWARDRFKTPKRFFARFFVHNYCPLCFMEASGRNLTPDKLPAGQRDPLNEHCDEALRDLVSVLQPKRLVGVGGFAEKRLRTVFPDFDGLIGRIPHPSPASPAANRGWAEAADKAFAELKIPLPK